MAINQPRELCLNEIDQVRGGATDVYRALSQVAHMKAETERSPSYTWNDLSGDMARAFG